MTNRQRYIRAFGALHVSPERLKEVYFMEKDRKTSHVGRIALIAVCVMVLLTVSVYAANEATDGAVIGRIVDLVDAVTGKLIPRDEGYRFVTEDGRSYDITVVDGSDSGTTSDGSVSYQVTYPGQWTGADADIAAQFGDVQK